MQALILAAGYGSRLKLITNHKPKTLIPIYGVPLLERILHSLKEVKIKECVIVIGYRGEQIKKYFGNEWKGIKIIYRKSGWYGDGILKSIIRAKTAIKENFLLILGDMLVSPKIIKAMLEMKGDAIIGVHNLNDSKSVALVSGNKVKMVGMIDELKKWNRALAGIAVYTQNFWKAVEACIRNKRYDRPHAIQWLIDNGYEVRAYDMSEDYWFEIDTLEDLERAKREIFEKAWKTRLKSVSFFKKYFNLPISLRLTKLLVKTPITPNQVTLITLFIFSVAGLSFLLKEFILGGILAYVAVLVDAVDGKIARLKLKQSRFGAFFDSFSDRISELLVIIGLSFGLFFSTRSWTVLVIGFFTLFGWLGRFYLKELFYHYIIEIKNKGVWKSLPTPKILSLRDRDVSCFFLIVVCILGLPLLGLIYLFFFSNIYLFFRLFQTLKVLKEIG